MYTLILITVKHLTTPPLFWVTFIIQAYDMHEGTFHGKMTFNTWSFALPDCVYT